MMTTIDRVEVVAHGGRQAIFGDWAVTRFGLECIATEYAISAARLGEDWGQHMAEKRWVVQEDFAAALRAARNYHGVREVAGGR